MTSVFLGTSVQQRNLAVERGLVSFRIVAVDICPGLSNSHPKPGSGLVPVGADS